MRPRRRQALRSLPVALALAGCVILWPRPRSVVYIGRFENLTVSGGHVELAALEAGFRDDIVMRLDSNPRLAALTNEDGRGDDAFDLVVSGAFAIVSPRGLMAVVRITDGSGRYLASGSWTSDALSVDMLRDRTSMWVAHEVAELARDSRRLTGSRGAAQAYADVVQAADDEDLDPARALATADVGEYEGADAAAVALIRGELNRRRGRCWDAAADLDDAPDAPADCLRGLLSWSVAYECADPPLAEPEILRAARRAVATFPDLPMTWRTLALLSRDGKERTRAIRNAVALQIVEGSPYALGQHLHTLSLRAVTSDEALCAAASSVLIHPDAGTSPHKRLLRLGGARADDTYAYGTEARKAEDARLWSLARTSRDWATLVALASFARDRREWRGKTYRPPDGAQVTGNALAALDRATDASDYARAALKQRLMGVDPQPAFRALPDWRRLDRAGERWWRPMADVYASAYRARYPAAAVADDGKQDRGPAGGNACAAPNYEMAAADYRRILQDFDPESRHGARMLNEMYEAQGEHDRAVAVWQDVVHAQPESPNCARGLALALLARAQSSLASTDRDEARDALNHYLNVARWRCSAVLEAVLVLAGLGGSGHSVVQPEAAFARPFCEDAVRYLERLGTPRAPAVLRLRGWARSQVGDLSGSLEDLGRALDSTRWERRLQAAPDAIDPLCLEPSLHSIVSGPSRGLLLAHLADTWLRKGDPEESARWLLLARRSQRLELAARLSARTTHDTRLVAADRTLTAFVPPFSSQGGRLAWWFGCGATISQFIVEDLDGDGEGEVIIGTSSDGPDRAALYIVDNRGRMRARFAAGSDVPRPLGRRFRISALVTLDVDGDGYREIAAAATHHVEGVARLVILDRRLRVIGDYWHPGHIACLAPWPWMRHGALVDGLAFAARNNDRGAPDQMVGMCGLLLGQGLRAQAEPCLAPGHPIAAVEQQPIYTETDGLKIGGPPDVMRARSDGLLQLFCRGPAAKGRHNGVLIDATGRRVGWDDRDPGDPPNASKPIELTGDQVAFVIGVSQYPGLRNSPAQLDAGVSELQTGLAACGCTLVPPLRNNGATRDRVLASIRDMLPKQCRRTGTVAWLHFSGHAFARRVNGQSDIYLQMYDAAGKDDTVHAVSLRELWRALGDAVPHSPVLVTLDCCLKGPNVADHGSALETLLDLHTWASSSSAAPIDGAIITACAPGHTANASDFLRAANVTLGSLRGSRFTARTFFKKLREHASASFDPHLYFGGDMVIASVPHSRNAERTPATQQRTRSGTPHPAEQGAGRRHPPRR